MTRRAAWKGPPCAAPSVRNYSPAGDRPDCRRVSGRERRASWRAGWSSSPPEATAVRRIGRRSRSVWATSSPPESAPQDVRCSRPRRRALFTPSAKSLMNLSWREDCGVHLKVAPVRAHQRGTGEEAARATPSRRQPTPGERRTRAQTRQASVEQQSERQHPPGSISGHGAAQRAESSVPPVRSASRRRPWCHPPRPPRRSVSGR